MLRGLADPAARAQEEQAAHGSRCFTGGQAQGTM